LTILLRDNLLRDKPVLLRQKLPLRRAWLLLNPWLLLDARLSRPARLRSLRPRRRLLSCCVTLGDQDGRKQQHERGSQCGPKPQRRARCSRVLDAVHKLPQLFEVLPSLFNPLQLPSSLAFDNASSVSST